MNWPNLVQDHCRCQVLRYVGRYLWARLQFFSLSTSLPVAVRKEKKNQPQIMGIENSAKGEQGMVRNMEHYTYTPRHKESKEFLSWQKFRKEEKDTVLLGPELCLSIQRAGGCLPMHARTLHLSSLRPSKTVIWSGQILLFLPLLEAEILQSLQYSNLAQKLYFRSRQR